MTAQWPKSCSKQKRGAVMPLIRSRGNRDTELRLITIMRDRGITGWRRNRLFFGKPDFVFPQPEVAVFVTAASGTSARPPHRAKTNAAFLKSNIAARRGGFVTGLIHADCLNQLFAVQIKLR
jgi:DNA mismatch endonuclease (patch repair protein)